MSDLGGFPIPDECLPALERLFAQGWLPGPTIHIPLPKGYENARFDDSFLRLPEEGKR